jgi:hypothetical protein
MDFESVAVGEFWTTDWKSIVRSAGRTARRKPPRLARAVAESSQSLKGGD